MKKYITLLILTILIVAACSPQETPTLEPTEAPSSITLTISGSGSVTPILEAIVEAFEAATPGYVLEVLPGSGTGGGVRGAIDGSLDLAAMSRPAKDSENEDGIQFVPVGSSVTTIMAHRNIGMYELTQEQLIDIFTGDITNWSEVGGIDQEIALYVRDPEESNTKDIRDAFLGDIEFVESAQVLTSQTEMQNVLTNVEGAVGYGTWATVLANGSDVKSLTVDGIGVDTPSAELVGTIGVGYLVDRKDDVQPLIDWLLSEEGQAALKTVGVIPISSE